jgi:rod shape-determining protein MreC
VKNNPRAISRITQPLRNFAQRFAYVGLIVAAFGLMMLGKVDALLVERFRAQVTDAVAPILDALSRPIATITEIVETGQELVALREENARLRGEVARLLQWQTAARHLDAENQLLRGMLHYVPDPEASYISARVIADTGGAFVHSLILNAGARDGVRKGQAAVTGEGLVGRIAGVGTRSSRLLLITDLNSRIPVLVEPTRTRAILAGDNSDRPRLVHLPQGATVSPGARIVTSGHGGVFPAGLPIGVVVAVSDGGISVKPFVDRDKIEYVRVVDFGLTGILENPPATRPETPAGRGNGGRVRVGGP